MKTQLAFAFCAASISIAATQDARAAEAGGEAIELKQRYIPGKKYHQNMVVDQNSTFQIGGQKMVQKMKLTYEMSMGVHAAEDGKKRVSTKYERIAMDMDQNGQKMAFDSAKPGEGGGPLDSIGTMAGLEFDVILDKDDKVLDTSDFTKKMEKAFAGQPGAAMMKGMFSGESIKQMFEQSGTQGLPKKPVKVGDKWDSNSEVQMGGLGKVQISMKNMLKGFEEKGGANCAVIDVSGRLSMDLAAEGEKEENPATQMLKALGMKVEGGKISGVVHFDPKLGMARSAVMDQVMNLTMKDPTNPDGDAITMPAKQKVTVNLTKIEDLSSK